MHGDGTKLDNIPNKPPPARLLDVTRLIRRAGRLLTGVDRVEMAYLSEFLEHSVPIFGLVRTSFGYVLLDRTGLCEIKSKLCGTVPFAGIDALSRLPLGLTQTQRQALTEVRKRSIAHSTPRKLERMLAENLPPNTSYINVGHSNITDRVFAGVKDALRGQISVMIHDVIPLDFPEFQRIGTVEGFRKKLKRVQRYADLIIYNSQDTQVRSEKYLGVWGEIPDAIVSHLGTVMPHVATNFTLPTAPYFVSVSTIEPRKITNFLLDLWEGLGSGAPELHICGARGC